MYIKKSFFLTEGRCFVLLKVVILVALLKGKDLFLFKSHIEK